MHPEKIKMSLTYCNQIVMKFCFFNMVIVLCRKQNLNENLSMGISIGIKIYSKTWLNGLALFGWAAWPLLTLLVVVGLFVEGMTDRSSIDA
uniref:Uncharacterized protein n=1 Tax=Romanomermis culicivorax TaxID=13658 RepID=A0A915J1G6_ROMCU